jgi:diguanylate cyclase (GGDEF)-like protein
MCKRSGWVGVALLNLMLMSCAAQAAELPFELEHLATSRTTADVLAGRADAEFVRLPTHQFKPTQANADYWLRVRLPENLPREQLVLAIRRVPIDIVTFYLQGADGSWQSLESGTLSANDALPYNVCCFGFELPAAAVGAAPLRAVYLHVSDSSPTELIIRLQPWREFAQRDRLETITVALVLGTLLAMFAVNALFWRVLRDHDYLHLAIFQGSLAVYLAASADLFYALPDDMGVGIPGQFPWLLAAGLAASFSASFIQRFVSLATYWPRFSRGMDVMRYVVLGISLLTLLRYASLAEYVRQSFNASLLVLAVFSGLAPVLAFKHARRSATFVLVGWLIYVLLVANRTNAAMGFGTLDAFSQYAFQIGSALLAVVLTIGLADRTLELRQQRDRAQFLRDQALKRLDIERARRALVDGLAELGRQGGTDRSAAHRHMLLAIGEVMTLEAAGVMIEAGQGERVMVAEPASAGQAFADLFQPRIATLRSIAVSRRPLVMTPDEEEAAASSDAHTAVVPIAVGGDGWGVILLSRPKWQKFSHKDLEVAADFGGLTVKALQEADQQAELQQRASFDALTGALNRGHLETLLEKGFQQAVLQRHPFSVLFIDLDYFKRVNDDHGHAAGDECLSAVARRISMCLDKEHVLGRFGGEEFLVLLPHMAEPAARQLGERIRVVVDGEPVATKALNLAVTVSIGGASRLAGEITPRMLLERADQALYRAKHEGRNRVGWSEGSAVQIA